MHGLAKVGVLLACLSTTCGCARIMSENVSPTVIPEAVAEPPRVSSELEQRTNQLVASCRRGLTHQQAASESVMELLVRNNIDQSTGRFKPDVNPILVNTGTKLYALNVAITAGVISRASCVSATIEIQKDLLALDPPLDL